MTETSAAEGRKKEFIVKMSSPWTILLIPGVATLYVGLVVLMAIGKLSTFGLRLQEWVYGGLALLAILLFWGWLLTLKRTPKVAKAPVQDESDELLEDLRHRVEEEEAQPVNVPIRAPAPAPAASATHEIIVSGEEYKGRKVIEVSMPPKSAHRGGVYTKTYVPVDDALVVRIEDLVEEPEELFA